MPAGPGSVAPGAVRSKGADRDAPLTVRPKAKAGASEKDSKPAPIPLPSGPSHARPAHTTPWAFWSSYYKPNPDPKLDEERDSPANLQETVTLLNWNKKFADTQAALMAYLTYRPKHREAWMYEALAVALKENKGKEADVRASLTYAADLAQRSHNPNLLLSVADLQFMLGYYDRVGPLLDEVIEKIPHRAEPILLSVMLALKTKDPRRMADSVDRLLALGWPLRDDQVRRDARSVAERLARSLREDGRADEADALLARLPDAEARDLFVRLTWTGDADLDLVVEEPLGARAQYRTPRTVFGGAIVKNGYGKHPEEVYVCPRAFDGDYSVRIDIIYNDNKIRPRKETEKAPEQPATRATLEIITHEGTPQEHKETRTIAIGEKSPAPVVVHLTGGRRRAVLPYLANPTPAPTAIAGKPANARVGDPKAARPKP